MRRGSKRRIIIGTLIVVMLIAVFGLALHLIEKHGLKDEQFGDSGEWGNAQDGPIVFNLDGKDYITNDSIDTYLIAGTDTGAVDKGKGFNGDMADFIMLLLIDNTTKKYAFYEIDRNSMTNVPVMSVGGSFEDFVYQQICTSHWYGNDEDERNYNLSNSVVSLFGGVPVGIFYVMSMTDIATVNDAIGGVTVTIPTDMTSEDPAFKQGASVHLEGKQAESFVRARSSLADDTNAARMSRQEQYIKNAYSMIVEKLRQNPEYINDLYEGLEGVFESNGNGNDMSKVTNKVIQYDNVGFLSFDAVTKVGSVLDDGKEHEETYVDEKSILAELRKVMNIEDYVDTDDVEDEDEDLLADPDDAPGAAASGKNQAAESTDTDEDSDSEDAEDDSAEDEEDDDEYEEEEPF